MFWEELLSKYSCRTGENSLAERISIVNTNTNGIFAGNMNEHEYHQAFCVGMCGYGYKKGKAYIKMELICPVANDFVFSRSVSDLVLVDLIAPGGISVFIEEHWVASYAYMRE